MAGGLLDRAAHILPWPFGMIGIGVLENCFARSLERDTRKCKDRTRHRIDHLTTHDRRSSSAFVPMTRR
jgi:hypothetical protein